MKEAKFYEKLDKHNVKCRLCHQQCLIANNKTGLCGARVNRNGALYSLIYGYPVSCAIDPIEKKPLYHFYPQSNAYSIGTFGCNFSCQNCQNWTQTQESEIEKKLARLDPVLPERIIEEALGNDCLSIAYTYNEPTIFTEYALDIMKLAHANGLKNVWVSNGYMSEGCLDQIIPYLDAVNVDLKSFDPLFYQKICGAKLEPILENLRRLKSEQVALEISTLIIPGYSDDIEMLEGLTQFIASELDSDTPWHVLKFSPEISWKMKNNEATGEDIVYQAYEIGKENGLKYVYVGNIPGDQKENTYCPQCKELAIRRMGHYVERLDNNGHCAYCDRSLDIVE